MGPPQLFQDLRVGGPAGLGPLAVGHPQALKEDLPQLLGGVDVEFPGVGVNLLLQSLDSGGQRVPKGPQGPGVHPEARQLHLRQNPAQGELDGKVQLLRPGLLQLGQHGPVQRLHSGGVAVEDGLRPGGTAQGGKGVRLQVHGLGQLLLEPGGEEPGDVVMSRRGVQQVARQGGVENKSLGGKAVFQQCAG